jgi:hypothetical protein
MSDQERVLLLYLLRHERPGYLALREQVPVAIHKGYWFERLVGQRDGAWTIRLRVLSVHTCSAVIA